MQKTDTMIAAAASPFKQVTLLCGANVQQ